MWQPPLFERDVVPEEAALRPTAVSTCSSWSVPTSESSSPETAVTPGISAMRGRDGFRDGSAEQLGGTAASDRQVGAVLLDALLHILLHALR